MSLAEGLSRMQVGDRTNWEGLQITRGLDCALAVGAPGLIAAKHKEIQRSEGGLQAVRSGPGKLLLFKDWKQVPEWLVHMLFGFSEVKLGFKAVKYQLPGLFKPDGAYDLVNDRTIVFRATTEVPPAVLDYYADKLSESDPRYQFSQLDGDLVAMVSSGLTSDNAQEICKLLLSRYSDRVPGRSHYVMTGSASARYTEHGWKLRIPESFIVNVAEYRRVLENLERTGDVLPKKVKAEAIVEQLNAWDDLQTTLQKCKNYIEEEHCTSTVVLLADVYSKRHNRKFDAVYTFKLVGGSIEEKTLLQPDCVDLSPGIPGCYIYFCFTTNKFKSGNVHALTKPDELTKLLCDAVASDDVEGTKRFTCGLSSVNKADALGRLPLVEACKVGNKDVVDWLLGEGADTELTDGDCLWPYLAALASGHCSLLPKLGCSHKINADTLYAAVSKEQEKLVHALVQAGADPSAEDAAGGVPLVTASWRLSLATLKVLAEAASEIDVEDKIGVTALQCAKKRGAEYLDVLLSAKRTKAKRVA